MARLGVFSGDLFVQGAFDTSIGGFGSYDQDLIEFRVVGAPSGIALAMVQTNGVGEAEALPSTLSVISTEQDPLVEVGASPASESILSALATAIASAAGFTDTQSLTVAENDPTVVTAAIAAILGLAAALLEGSTAGNPAGTPAGQSLTPAQNNPGEVDVTAFPRRIHKRHPFWI